MSPGHHNIQNKSWNAGNLPIYAKSALCQVISLKLEENIGTHSDDQGWGLLSKIHVKFCVSWQGFPNMASDWLVAVLPANQMPSLKFFVH